MNYLATAKRSLEIIRSGSTQSFTAERLRTRKRTPEQFAAMSLAEFAHAGLVIRLRSGVLDCEILFVSDNIADTELPETGLTVYRASELLKIAVLRPEPHTLRYLYEAETVLRGSITDVQPIGDY